MRDRRLKNPGVRFHEVRTLRWIQAVLGLVLVVAGALKFYAFVVADGGDDLATPWLALLSEAEFFAGIWLVSGRHAPRTRPWAIAIFAGLWVTSLCRVLTGRCSCGCFGDVAVSPWYVLVFDTIALAVLLKWQPPRDRPAEISPGALRKIGMALTTLVIVGDGFLQPDSVTAAGTARFRGKPLADTPLVFRGNSLEFRVRTDERGRFRLPPVRPGQYSVSMTRSPSPQEPEPHALGRNHPFRGSVGRFQASSAGKRSRGSPEKSSDLAREYANLNIISFEIEDCSTSDIVLDFK